MKQVKYNNGEKLRLFGSAAHYYYQKNIYHCNY